MVMIILKIINVNITGFTMQKGDFIMRNTAVQGRKNA